jgi:hypothetical protein
MKRMALYLALAAIVWPLCARSAESPDLQAQLKAAYANQCKTLVAADVDAWGATHLPGFIATSTNGTKVDLPTAMANLRKVLSNAKFSDCSIAVQSIGKNGNDIVATVTLTLNGTATDPEGSAPLAIIQNGVGDWSSQGGPWLQKSWAVSEQIVKVNGTIVQHDLAPSPSPSSSPHERHS